MLEAMLMARLAAVNVLPSPGAVLVIRIERGGWPATG